MDWLWRALGYNSEEDIVNQGFTSNNMPKKLRTPGVTILNEILGTIKLDQKTIDENNVILGAFLSTFIEEMKDQDDLFKSIYQNVHYTGSFYTDLRISQPDEFDLNIVLKMPFKPSDFSIEYCPQVPSYAIYRLKRPQDYQQSNPKLIREFFEDGYLLHEKVRRWMQSLVDKALIRYPMPRGVIGIRKSASGPARTLQLQKRNGIIDIDLVPVLSCCLDAKQPGIDGRVYQKLVTLKESKLQAFLVPKPYSHPPGKQCPVNTREITRLWRTHFPEVEKKLIYNYGCVKPVIKLLKLLRDKENWKILASYYLKTVVMWMIIETPDKESWKEDKIDLRFIQALKRLQEYVKAEKLPYFFSKSHNLINKINSSQSANISNRLNVIIRDVEKDPMNFWKVFNVTPTFAI